MLHRTLISFMVALLMASCATGRRPIAGETVSVTGAVNRPGEIAFRTGMSLLQAIEAAGGLSGSHGETLTISRTARNGLTDQLEIRIDALTVARDPDLNVPLTPGDVINVSARISAGLSVQVTGEVANPGPVAFGASEAATLLLAIARAGGWAERANRRRVTVRRQSGEFEVDLQKILAGSEQDVVLQNGDVVIVGK